MKTLAELHPTIQTSICRLADPGLSFSELGARFQISKQAVARRLAVGIPLIAGLHSDEHSPRERELSDKLGRAEARIREQDELMRGLRLRIVLCNAVIFMLTILKGRILAAFPQFKLKRLTAYEKKSILDLWSKFERLGGNLKDFANAVERSPSTLQSWLEAYLAQGISGLFDKTTRPKNFGHKLPLWIREQLLRLFLRHPEWTSYQYHKHMRGNPAIDFYVSLPTIEKMKREQREATSEEKARQKKLWAFARGTVAWTVDFTCLLKSDRFKLQLLTVTDQRSRLILETALFLDPSTERVLNHLEDLFIKYGRPFIIKADNGPEFRLECRDGLNAFGVYLFNSPTYYGQFCGAHERMHRELKGFISDFDGHRNLERLVLEISRYRDSRNYSWPLEILGGKTPAQIYYSDEDFIPKDVEVVAPYVKDGELRMKFTGRDGMPSRMSVPEIPGAKAP